MCMHIAQFYVLKGELSPNFTFWDESASGWSTYWKVVTQNREIGEGEPLKKTIQSCLCTAQVRCDVDTFRTISVRFVQLIKWKKVYACREYASVLQYVYAFRNYLSEFLRQSCTPCHQVLRDVTRHFNSTGLLGTFQASNIGEWYTKNFSGVALSY